MSEVSARLVFGGFVGRNDMKRISEALGAARFENAFDESGEAITANEAIARAISEGTNAKVSASTTRGAASVTEVLDGTSVDYRLEVHDECADIANFRTRRSGVVTEGRNVYEHPVATRTEILEAFERVRIPQLLARLEASYFEPPPLVLLESAREELAQAATQERDDLETSAGNVKEQAEIPSSSFFENISKMRKCRIGLSPHAKVTGTW